MKLLITGIAGFIGYHLANRLASAGHDSIGLDNLNEYYDVELKHGRLRALGLQPDTCKSNRYPNLSFVKIDLSDPDRVTALFAAEGFDTVLHLAAQAGVRYSLTNPNAYISSNIQGFLNILEAIRRYPVQHLVYASSSSVYGLNTAVPFSETAPVNQPASLYAVSKRANELTAYSYAHLYRIPSTGLRFFTVYGPWGRPDMAPFLFTKSILEGTPIRVFNNGDMQRDFTYIDDIIEAIVRLMPRAPKDAAAIYNIGYGSPVNLLEFISVLESELGIEAKKVFLPMQPGDVPITWADCSALEHATGYRPQIAIQQGIKRFAGWYRAFYRI